MRASTKPFGHAAENQAIQWPLVELVAQAEMLRVGRRECSGSGTPLGLPVCATRRRCASILSKMAQGPDPDGNSGCIGLASESA